MPSSPTPQLTDFSRDVLGRYVCNGFDEATDSADAAKHPGARPFDLIVIGGGSFGAVLASHLFFNDTTRAHRILVLEAGQFAFPEHVQNLPPALNAGEVWGLPWTSDSPKNWNQRFPGLAYCVGGRSVFWGGWSPYFIDSELPADQWPKLVRHDLTAPVLPASAPARSYLDDAARQIGTDVQNDFVDGALHTALRDRLFDGLRARVPNATALVGHRGTPMTAGKTEKELQAELEAPLAVQSASPRPGFFPFNKFNGVQLLARAARVAQAEAEATAVGTPADIAVNKRLMVVPNTHVIRLDHDGQRVVRVLTNQGELIVPAGGHVFLAAGTIESTRLALASVPNVNTLVGRNLMAHLRSNLTIRVPRASFDAALAGLKELSVSALFVKGVHTHADGTLGHFHVQITASGGGIATVDSEAELFKKIPDIDTLDRFATLTDDWIVITLRGIGEMLGDKTSPEPENRIKLDQLGPQGPYDYGQPRALVRLEAEDPADPEQHNIALWNAMDAACDELALVFAGGGPVQYLARGNWQDTSPSADARRDTLSSTHHEGGTLWMGEDPTTSVTDEWGRFHDTENLYAVGPAVLPTLGSPNPMLSGVALTRRTADHLVPHAVVPPAEANFRYLFDGTERTFGRWQKVGGGAFKLVDGTIVCQPDPGGELGLLFYATQGFADFVLRLQFRAESSTDNSGVFVRSRDPRRPVPDRNDPTVPPHEYRNKHWVAADTGFELQIDDSAGPDGLDLHRTGAVYGIPLGNQPGQQDYQRPPAVLVGEWQDLEIEVKGQSYTVRLNDVQTSIFTNTDGHRGKPATGDFALTSTGFLGLQTHTGRVAFRRIRIAEV